MNQAKLVLLGLAMGALPVWALPLGAQMGAGSSGVGTGQTGAIGRGAATPLQRGGDGAGREEAESGDRLASLLAGEAPATWRATRFTSTVFQPFTIDRIETAGLSGRNEVQFREQAPATPSNPDALTWHGITVYGVYDIGLGWVSHGLPVNGYNYEGESLVNRNGYEHRFLPAPNNLQQTGLGVRGREKFADGWFVVFNASTGINPNSGLLANASLTDINNNGLPRASYSEAIDGTRAGQPFNDEYDGGVSSESFGTRDLRPAAVVGYGCDAADRSGWRRVCVFVHRI